MLKNVEVTPSCKNHAKSIIEDGASVVATILCQTLLFFAQMVGACGFDVATILEKAAAMCKVEKGQLVATIETEALAEVDSEAKSTMEASLYVGAAKIQTMLRRLAIE